MSERYDVVVAGHLCLDLFPDLADSFQDQFEKTFLPGHTLEVGPVTFCTGGPVSNTGLALNTLGIQTRLIGKVGADRLGGIVRDVIQTYGPHLADGIITDRASNTSYTIVISPPGVDRLFMHSPGANETFSADDIDYDIVADARLFHFGYPPVLKLMFQDDGRQLVEIFRRVKESGVTTSLDMSLPNPLSDAGRADWAAILGGVLPYVDLFLPSIEEILYMLRRPLYHDLIQTESREGIPALISPELLSDLSSELLSMGTKIVGIKLGSWGYYLRTASEPEISTLGRARPVKSAEWADKELWAPCFKVDVAGTTGAGDATIAGFLSALLRNFSPEAAVTAAVAVGACNVEAMDALGGIREWDLIMQRVAGGWARHPIDLKAVGWRFDKKDQLWVREDRQQMAGASQT